jgi:hypothetical protein
MHSKIIWTILNWEESKMRSIAIVLATFVASAPAAAQGWEEYGYPDYAFSVAFPANPQVEQTTYQVAPGRPVPARVYSLSQSNVIFKMTVAELEGTTIEENAIIDHAIKTLSQSATLRVNIPARIYQVYGRQLTVEGADGSRSMVQLFDYKGRLYQIEAKAFPGQNVSGPQSDVVRFHQSLTFTDGGSNRSEDAVRHSRGLSRPGESRLWRRPRRPSLHSSLRDAATLPVRPLSVPAAALD